ncbi:hypothetical protein ACOZ38_43600 [Sphaerisporangium viridialbum]|uniref:hypothetical protein n=1 Tax=Sphaerisporangium viridialbum TaxID=46189 RepID=UPI003C75B290
MTAPGPAGAQIPVVGGSSARRSPATVAALRLSRELESFGITADPHEGDRVAALSVCAGLVIWCESGPGGLRYRWWTGRVSERTGRWVYTWCSTHAPESAARRVAMRYRELRGLNAESGSGRG